MGLAYLLSSKLSDAATITASDAVGNAGASNLLISRPRLKWRSTTATPNLVLDLGAPKTIDTLMHGYSNGMAGDTFTLRMASTQAKLTDGTAEFNAAQASQPMWPNGSNLAAYDQIHRGYKLPGSGVTLRWARIDYNFSGNSDGFVDMGRLLLGKRIEPAVSVKAGWVSGGTEAVAETVDLSGEESPRQMGTKRDLSATWHDLIESEKNAIYEMLLERGSAKDFALVIDPDSLYPMACTVIGRCKQKFQFPQTINTGSDPNSSGGRGGLHFTVVLMVAEMAPLIMA
jgi:hypothetical protein